MKTCIWVVEVYFNGRWMIDSLTVYLTRAAARGSMEGKARYCKRRVVQYVPRVA